MNRVNGNVRFGDQYLAELRSFRESTPKITEDKASGISFMDHLKNEVSKVDQMQKTADSMGVNISSGKDENIHEAMLAATQAELSFNLMVQIRNKVLDAYQEIMRMQV